MCCERKNLVPFLDSNKKLWRCQACGKLYKVVLSVWKDGYESRLEEVEQKE